MDPQLTPEERERQAEQLKKALEQLRKGADENPREQLKRRRSPKAKRPQRKSQG